MKNSRRVASLALATLMVTTLTGVGRAATNVVVPGANATTEGVNVDSVPFNLDADSLSSERYQQVYAASQFSSISGPRLITDILFRPDFSSGTASAFSSTLANVRIDLSTTSKAVDGLSLTFADNAGADDAIVHSGALALSSAYTGSGPKDFDILIHLTTPFTYDPSAGNLLLDVRNFSAGRTTPFDSLQEFVNNGATSRVFTVLSDVTSASGDFSDSGGLVTEFVFADAAPSAVPLPAAFPAGMVLLGALGLTKRLTRK